MQGSQAEVPGQVWPVQQSNKDLMARCTAKDTDIGA
jgi:hypothetical protein